jgi:hypothetical protein
MAGIFQNGVASMGFDMDPTGSLIWTQLNRGSASNSVTPYGFGYSWNISNGVGMFLGTNLTSYYVGYAWDPLGAPTSYEPILTFYDATAGSAQVTLQVNATGNVQFFLGTSATAIGPASTLTVPLSSFTYIECFITISGSVGQVICYLNGNLAITTSATQNTKNTANSFLNAVQWNQPAGSTYYVDDIYQLDTTGTSPLNTFLGPVQVRGDAANANSAVGGRNAWTPTSPTGVNWENVANVPASNTEYNADSNPGDYDMFRFPALPSNAAQVFFINEWALLDLDSAGSRTVETNIYSNGTDSPSAAFTPALGTPTLYNQVATVDPHTSSAWSVANAGAAELGVKVET